jgi:hypothetical protein
MITRVRRGLIMKKEFYKSWYIKGIAESVIREINDDGEDIDDVLDDYLKDVYWSVYSRETIDAVIVTELVRQYIEEQES